MKKLLPVFLLVFIGCFLFLDVQISKSDQLDDVNAQLQKLENELNSSVNATKPLQSQVTNMQQQITSIKSQVNAISADLVVKQKNIDDGYKNLAKQELILNTTVRDFYIKSYSQSPLLTLLSTKSAADATQVLAYQQAATDEDKQIITNIALSIQELEIRKKDLQSEQTRLIALKTNLDTQSAKLNQVIQQAQAYQSTLNSQIAQLTAQQQQLIAQKQASLGLPTQAYTSQGGCTSDINVDPGFSPRFAVFTYGVPNRVGLNQYGAKGRANAGESYNDILNAYYQNMQITTMNSGGTNVTVNGTNDYGESFSNQQMSVEDYLTHIYEMPSDWPSEALKAQAIAARSYVMHAIANGQTTVAPNQSFQEVKTEQNAASWIAAVNATNGQVMTSGGQPIEAWFSSTFGGYTLTSSDIGWSSTSYTKEMYDGTGSVNSFSDLQNNAYDKDSPWFYCDWGSRAQYNKTAWLQPSELADIANVILLSQADSSTISHLSQVDKDVPDTWDANAVKTQLQNRNITPYNSVSSISISADFSHGSVSSVTINGDGGSHNFSGATFKQMFNVRAPANLEIVGPLYNIEQK